MNTVFDRHFLREDRIDRDMGLVFQCRMLLRRRFESAPAPSLDGFLSTAQYQGAPQSPFLSIKRPLTSQFFNCAVVNIDVHVVFGARYGVEAGAAIPMAAILFAGELPDTVGRPGALRKVSHVSLETRIPQMRLCEDVISSELIRDRLCHFIVSVYQRIASRLLFDSVDESPRIVEAHVL